MDCKNWIEFYAVGSDVDNYVLNLKADDAAKCLLRCAGVAYTIQSASQGHFIVHVVDEGKTEMFSILATSPCDAEQKYLQSVMANTKIYASTKRNKPVFITTMAKYRERCPEKLEEFKDKLLTPETYKNRIITRLQYIKWHYGENEEVLPILADFLAKSGHKDIAKILTEP